MTPIRYGETKGPLSPNQKYFISNMYEFYRNFETKLGSNQKNNACNFEPHPFLFDASDRNKNLTEK